MANSFISYKVTTTISVVGTSTTNLAPTLSPPTTFKIYTDGGIYNIYNQFESEQGTVDSQNEEGYTAVGRGSDEGTVFALNLDRLYIPSLYYFANQALNSDPGKHIVINTDYKTRMESHYQVGWLLILHSICSHLLGNQRGSWYWWEFLSCHL